MGFWSNFSRITSINRDHNDSSSSSSINNIDCSHGCDTRGAGGGLGVSLQHHRKALDLASVQQSVAAAGWAEGLKSVDLRDGKKWAAEAAEAAEAAHACAAAPPPDDTPASQRLAEGGEAVLYSATADFLPRQQIEDLDRAAAASALISCDAGNNGRDLRRLWSRGLLGGLLGIAALRARGSRQDCWTTGRCQKWRRRDQRPVEKALNIISCAPFFLVGLNTPRAKECPKARLYSQSVMGIGAAAMAYHASSGPVSRPILHWLDCTMIAISTLCFSRAALPADQHSAALMAVSTAMVPVRPSLVMGVHWGLLEASFWRRSRREPSLARAHSLHVATAVTAGAAMLADKTVAHHPALHALWHVVAAGVLHTANVLLLTPSASS
ncbi:hypothetical protein CLOM_g22686 [Closterium sp. NIES-68]|nr:hypothetical protein CLOM_g22686 [Closterium sp. NIES-68]GJP82429.1 hypothetical protein CLOP_g12689 [Closterium sp. NIES-67]